MVTDPLLSITSQRSTPTVMGWRRIARSAVDGLLSTWLVSVPEGRGPGGWSVSRYAAGRVARRARCSFDRPCRHGAVATRCTARGSDASTAAA